jgi:hypothetical protein
MRSCTDLSDIVRMIKRYRMRWVWHVAGVGEKICAYKVAIEKPNGRSLFRRQNYGRDDKIKMDLTGVG